MTQAEAARQWRKIYEQLKQVPRDSAQYHALLAQELIYLKLMYPNVLPNSGSRR